MDMYQIMFIGGMAGTFIFFLLSVLLFIKNDVRKKIGDLTGANARKAIKESYEKSHKNQKGLEGEALKITVRENENRKDSVKKTLKTQKKHKNEEWALGDEATELLQNVHDMDEATELLQTNASEDEATELLQTNDIGDEATELLQSDNDPEATDVLYQYQDEETELLSQDETAVLLQNVTETLVGEESTEPLYEEVNISEGDMDSILNGAVNAGEEIVTMPDIFEVEEDLMVVHADATI